MAKNKKAKAQQKPFNEKTYIRTKMRSLPIDKCYEIGDPAEGGITNIIVTRRHPSGTFSMALYLLDTYCCGVKDTLYRFSIPEEEIHELIEKQWGHIPHKEIDYVRAHNLVYGAVQYAEDNGIPPHADFALTQYFLEEDDDNVPLIEYEFGRDGMPFLVCTNPVELDKYRRMLLKVLKPDEFHELLLDYYGEYIDDDEYDDDEDDPNYQFREEIMEILQPIYNISYDLSELTAAQEKYFLLLFPGLLLLHLGKEYPEVSEIYEDWDGRDTDQKLEDLREVFAETIEEFNEFIDSCNPNLNPDVTNEEADRGIDVLIAYNILFDTVRTELSKLSDDECEALMLGDHNPVDLIKRIIDSGIDRRDSIIAQLDRIAPLPEED